VGENTIISSQLWEQMGGWGRPDDDFGGHFGVPMHILGSLGEHFGYMKVTFESLRSVFEKLIYIYIYIFHDFLRI